ncbi:6378_t:CDS:2 [Ambispora leptoticha]|uniref:6378_t:CDS:1 n=1 Tax=Ambispora leptoticha TaxID=144679 RepID=A0A9N8WI34_9GLOM|nr:6378_t:CDS:2 [Ambispora leptoticha]
MASPTRGRARNNLPGRLEIPSPMNSPSPSSAPSSLSPLILPASNISNAKVTTAQITNEIRTQILKVQPNDGEYGNGDEVPVIVSTSGFEGSAMKSDDFQELQRLGEGAGGMVTKVMHKATKKIMAKKKINVDPEPTVHRQILRELEFLQKCHSPNIVSYYGAFLEDEGSSIAIIMEFCEGGSLDAIYKTVSSRQGRISETVLGKISESVLKGLVHLYNNDIIHRDIKPSNILVTKRGEIKICDLGVSGKLVQSIASTFLGTSYYMAPERITGMPYRVSADVWSLGLTIMEVAQNRFPYPEELSPIELVAHIANAPAPELSNEYEWSEDLKSFLKFCLEKDGQKRPTPKQMLLHPFIQRTALKQVNLQEWIRDVWEWESSPNADSSLFDKLKNLNLSATES